MAADSSNQCVYCCPFPWIALPLVLEAIAVVCYGIAAFSCNTFVIIYTNDFGGITDDVDYEFGYWQAEYTTNECKAWDEIYDDDDELDSLNDASFQAGKAFGIIGFVLGGVHLLFLLTLTFIAFSRYKFALYVSSGLCFFLACCSALLFVGLDNDYICDEESEHFSDDYLSVKCKPSAAGFMAIVSLLFFVGAGVVMLLFGKGAWRGGFQPRNKTKRAQAFVGPSSAQPYHAPQGATANSTNPQPSYHHGAEQQVHSARQPNTYTSSDNKPSQEVSEEVVNNDDGTLTKTVTTTTYQSDGSKVVEKTVETIHAGTVEKGQAVEVDDFAVLPQIVMSGRRDELPTAVQTRTTAQRGLDP